VRLALLLRTMKTETIQHLCQVEVAIENAKALLTRHSYRADRRTLIVAAIIDQLIEHHEALLLLVRAEKTGSAFALARSIVEGMYRGLWLNFCATDAEIERFEKDDKLPFTMREIADAIDERYRGEGFFDDLKKRAWSALCSYAHTGMLQLGRRFTGHELKPQYSDAEIFEITTAVTTAILTLISKFCAVQGLVDASKEAETLIESFGPASKRSARTSSTPTVEPK
jgi:hypothetical protein